MNSDCQQGRSARLKGRSDIKKCKHCGATFQRPRLDSIPDDSCTRCHEAISAISWDEERADAIGQNGNDGDHYPKAKTRWASKPCIECGHTTAANVSDDKPVCPERVEKGEDMPDMEARSKYHREIKPGVWVDVYDVLQAWGVRNPALQHLIKKALAPGERGHKTLDQDMADIVASAERARELIE